ncbi:carboxylate-amine ligase [Acidimangrovimonas pyrenivorans]|uniref:Putative glutamate--cysteine ligase 2 n=1 Tax=Acidimangrovimonas pyrenivorans TaxID=2030798 RepID=A0ABV7ADA0_9RHOB
MNEPGFTIGIEEEYLLVDADSLDLAVAPATMMEACRADLEGQVSPEYLQCQVEVGTRVCSDLPMARQDLRRLRATISRRAAEHGLAPIAASCHPFARWQDQHHTRKERYDGLRRDLAAVVRRMLICGMHIHVGIEDRELRIALMNQLSYFLPHLLAMSASSPFWQGEDTGLASYRLTVFDNLPRTGLPPRLADWSAFDSAVAALTDVGVIEDGTKIWWDLRPSSRFPTLETRICDVSPRLEMTLALAALTQALARALWRLHRSNRSWRLHDLFLLAENRWRAQRYGISAGLIDFARHEIVDFPTLLVELLELVAEDAEALGCLAEVRALPALLAEGTSADRQRQVLVDAVEAGDTHDQALRAVVRHLVEEYHADL